MTQCSHKFALHFMVKCIYILQAEYDSTDLSTLLDLDTLAGAGCMHMKALKDKAGAYFSKGGECEKSIHPSGL